MALTKQNVTEFSDEEKEQIRHEYQQIKCSDLISAPTQYVYNFTKTLLEQDLSRIPYCTIPYCTIPNFINTDFCDIKSNPREIVCNNFNKLLKN